MDAGENDMSEFGYCFDCHEMNYALSNNNGTFIRENLSNNHIGHRQHSFGKPNNYCAPICNVLTKLNAGLPISQNEIIIFKLAIDFGELDKFEEAAEI